MVSMDKYLFLLLVLCITLLGPCSRANGQSNGSLSSSAAAGNETNSSTNPQPYPANTTAATATQGEAQNTTQYGLLAPGTWCGTGSFPSGSFTYGFGPGVPSANGGFSTLPPTATSSVDLNVTDDNANSGDGPTEIGSGMDGTGGGIGFDFLVGDGSGYNLTGYNSTLYGPTLYGPTGYTTMGYNPGGVPIAGVGVGAGFATSVGPVAVDVGATAGLSGIGVGVGVSADIGVGVSADIGGGGGFDMGGF